MYPGNERTRSSARNISTGAMRFFVGKRLKTDKAESPRSVSGEVEGLEGYPCVPTEGLNGTESLGLQSDGTSFRFPSCRENHEFVTKFDDLDTLVALLGDEEPFLVARRQLHDKVERRTSTGHDLVRRADHSITSDSCETATTVPTKNSISWTEHQVLTSFVYLTLLPTLRGSFDQGFDEAQQNTKVGERKPISGSPRDIVVSSLQVQIRMSASEDEVNDAWIKRMTLPVRVDDATLFLGKDVTSLYAVDEVAKLALVRHEYTKALEIYETLRHTLQIDFDRPLLSRLSILSFLVGDEEKAESYCLELIERSEQDSFEFVEGLVMKGFLRLGCGKLDEAMSTWREASYRVPTNCHNASLLWNNLACLQLLLGSYEDSIESLRQSLALQKQQKNSAEDMRQCLLNISTTQGNIAVVADLLGDCVTATTCLEESLLLQESILDENNYVIRLTKEHILRIYDKERASTALTCSPTILEEWSQPLFEECAGITLPRALTDIKGTADFIQLGPLVHEYSPNERVQESLMEAFGFLQQSANTKGFTRRRSALPVDVDENQIMEAESKLTVIYNDVTDLLLHNSITDALELLKFCLRSHYDKHGAVHPLVASTLHNIGIVLLFADMYAKALRYFQIAATIRISTLSIDHPDVGATMMKVGMIQVCRRDFDNALVTFTQVLHSRRNVLGYNNPQIVDVLNNIGCVHYERGGFIAASKSFDEALEILRKWGKKSSIVQLATSIVLSNHGFVLSKREMNKEALEVYHENADLLTTLYPRDHLKIALNVENLDFTTEMMKLTCARGEGANEQSFPDLVGPLNCGAGYL